jgi:hypothetical protein
MRGSRPGHPLDDELRMLRDVHLDAALDAQAPRPLIGAIDLGERRLDPGAVSPVGRAKDLVGGLAYMVDRPPILPRSGCGRGPESRVKPRDLPGPKSAVVELTIELPSAFARHVTRVLVLAERDELRMPQVIVRSPFGELELPDQL